jgi:hypothetical protein
VIIVRLTTVTSQSMPRSGESEEYSRTLGHYGALFLDERPLNRRQSWRACGDRSRTGRAGREERWDGDLPLSVHTRRGHEPVSCGVPTATLGDPLLLLPSSSPATTHFRPKTSGIRGDARATSDIATGVRKAAPRPPAPSWLPLNLRTFTLIPPEPG